MHAWAGETKLNSFKESALLLAELDNATRKYRQCTTENALKVKTIERLQGQIDEMKRNENTQVV